MKQTIEEKLNALLKEKEMWEKEKDYIIKKRQLNKDKKQIRGIKILSTSKILTLFLFLNCTVVELFTGWVTVQNLILAEKISASPDLTPLIALIGAIVGETISFAIYSIKATKQNCRGGITYQTAMQYVKEQSTKYNYDIDISSQRGQTEQDIEAEE